MFHVEHYDREISAVQLFRATILTVESAEETHANLTGTKEIEFLKACTAIRHCIPKLSGLCWPSSLWFSNKN